MDLEYSDDELRKLAIGESDRSKYDAAIVNSLRRRIAFIESALDERDLYAMKSMRFEKLKGDKDGLRSIRLNDQWRLIVEVVPGEPKNTIRVLKIEDYH